MLSTHYPSLHVTDDDGSNAFDDIEIGLPTHSGVAVVEFVGHSFQMLLRKLLLLKINARRNTG